MKFGPLFAIFLYLYSPQPCTLANPLEEAAEDFLEQERDIGILEGFIAAAMGLYPQLTERERTNFNFEFYCDITKAQISRLIENLETLSKRESLVSIRTRLALRAACEKLKILNKKTLNLSESVRKNPSTKPSVIWERYYNLFVHEYTEIISELKTSHLDQLPNREQRRQHLLASVTEAVLTGAVTGPLLLQFLETKKSHEDELRQFEEEKIKNETILKNIQISITKARKEMEDLKTLNREIDSLALKNIATYEQEKISYKEKWESEKRKDIETFEEEKKKLNLDFQEALLKFEEERGKQDLAIQKGNQAIASMQARFKDLETHNREQSIKTEIKFTDSGNLSEVFKKNFQKMLLNKHLIALRQSSVQDNLHLLGHQIEIEILQVRLKNGFRYRSKNWYEVSFSVHVKITALGYCSSTADYPGTLTLLVNDDGGIESGKATEETFNLMGNFFANTVDTQRKDALTTLKSQPYHHRLQSFNEDIAAYGNELGFPSPTLSADYSNSVASAPVFMEGNNEAIMNTPVLYAYPYNTPTYNQEPYHTLPSGGVYNNSVNSDELNRKLSSEPTEHVLR